MRKCVIIGSGLGGLSCGVILAKNGYEVTVLEQSAQIGGCLQCFYRDNVTFDTGMHYIGSADEGQTLNIIMNYLGISSDIELSRLDPMGYDVISYLGEHYRFANGRENFINALAEHFPENHDEIAKYYDLMKLVSSSSAMHSLNKDVDIDINAEYKMKSVNEVLDSIITGSDKAFRLRQVLAGMQPLYAGIKDHTPFSVHALIHDCFNQSAFRIVGGSSKVAASLAKSIQQKGGKVLPNQRVTKIECSDSSSPQATAVITSSGDRYPADLVISAIHPASTMRMTDSRFIRPYFLKRLEKAPNTPSVFVVYLKFKKNKVRYMNHNLYYYRGDTTWGCEQYDDFCPWQKSNKTLSNCLSPQTTDSRPWRESDKTLSISLPPQTADSVLDFSRILYKENGILHFTGDVRKPSTPLGMQGTIMDEQMMVAVQHAFEAQDVVNLDYAIKNTDRAVGTMLSGAIAKKYGLAGLPEDTVNVRFKGSAGQSFGAFLVHGVSFKLEGEANDYFGKGLSGGRIIIMPPVRANFSAEDNIIAGNTGLYGATSGEIFINGCVGERFSVRNSGAIAVVEGVGDHCCEYMTGGRVVVLGETGRNFAAGMSGGVAYVLDKKHNFDYFCNMDMVEINLVEDSVSRNELHELIRKHYLYTGSALANKILNDWQHYVEDFIQVVPIEYKRVLQEEQMAKLQKKIADMQREY